ncbi:DUF2975 domain-containing protein [Xylanimonas ulmi]|uniref:DUF2975 family protein n=1 Tax=Xylanimonas ulmi TaxID=228973 RepID=A0A4Q7M728_9MICO|nr:DUF2975 domain-containing protein [Xylanibacterium ulmi]RZS62438.1 DUF2975 family protein [Xylanibacterium ulmi]
MESLVSRAQRRVDTVLGRVGQTGALTLGALRLVLGAVFVGVLLAQALFVPLIADEMATTLPEAAFLRWPLLVMVIAGLAMVQVAVVCVWRLLTLVAESAVFSHAAFRYVDGIVLAGAVATALAVAALALTVATGMLQPGLLLVTCGAIVGGAGVTLLVVVLRALLVRAVALTDETAALHAELGGVI